MRAPQDSRRFTGQDTQAVRDLVSQIVSETPITDIHTHLYAPCFGSLLLYGIDELLTYHYLTAELFRVSEIPPEQFWSLEKREQAELTWKALFVERSPISEACRGVVTTLHRLGLDVTTRNLERYREHFRNVTIEEHLTRVFELAKLNSVIMTNDPFQEEEREVWLSRYRSDPRFHAALRVDPLLLDWDAACRKLKAFGYETDRALSKHGLQEVRRFLEEWIERTQALYLAVSLPPTFQYPDDGAATILLDQCLLPITKDRKLPFAMMIGVNRGVNPALRLAGDGVGRADVRVVERLCARFPENKFMVTMLSRENQHELCVAARKFPNLLAFGCWWFLNNPCLIEEMTRMRIELLGLTVVPQHSDARVLEQVIYKWDHSRTVIAKVLADKYADLVHAGWPVTEAQIRKDVGLLFGENFWEFLRR